MTNAKRRCAIYARKSTEEGLDQAFNTLDAQREACAAFVKSQTDEGWRAIQKKYDDGGWSGGTLQRPALQELINDIKTGKIDVVVVYKIDRLSRSLSDFVQLVELFDRHDVTFVSVTQAFNTTTSMGRLTLNVLLSFAQFEREVTGERIRDKIAASKARGLWMGGTPPLGYDLPSSSDRILQLNVEEADTVRMIFQRYLELGSVELLRRHLSGSGIVSKRRVTRSGRTLGGRPFSRGALFHLLQNQIYLGRIVHKGTAHEGRHPAIIDRALFDLVQARLKANTRRHSATKKDVAASPLKGRIFDEDGCHMTPVFSYGSKGRLYRYYVSTLAHQRRVDPGDRKPRRISAARIETFLEETILRLAPNASVHDLIRIEIKSVSTEILLPAKLLGVIQKRLASGEHAAIDEGIDGPVRVVLPTTFHARDGKTRFETSELTRKRYLDKPLIAALKQAHAMLERDHRGLPLLSEAPSSAYKRRILRLAFLSPSLQKAILEGRQPRKLTLSEINRAPPPLCWTAQELRYGTPLNH